MKYNIKAKETMYGGRLYRSRLEARWAAFFDLLGWEYDYEPFDMNGWTPDFIIFGTADNILVEIKPECLVDDALFNKIENAIKDGGLAGEYDYKIAAIVFNNSFIIDGYCALLMGKRISTEEPYEVHLKNYQNEYLYDIGSAYMAFDGILFNAVGQRKLFVGNGCHKDYDTEKVLKMWKEAGDTVRFKTYNK